MIQELDVLTTRHRSSISVQHEPKQSVKSQHLVLVASSGAQYFDTVRGDFEKNGFGVANFHDCDAILINAARLKPDVVVVDADFESCDAGYDLCEKLRSSPLTMDTMIIVLTEDESEALQVRAFASGADDVMSRTLSLRLLIARCKALVRRKRDDRSQGRQEVLTCNGLTVDRRTHRASIGNISLELTPTEFSLLEALLQNPGRVYSRGELIDATHSPGVIVLERTIDVHIRSLRSKLGSMSDSIETVRGVGYRFRETA